MKGKQKEYERKSKESERKIDLFLVGHLCRDDGMDQHSAYEATFGCNNVGAVSIIGFEICIVTATAIVTAHRKTLLMRRSGATGNGRLSLQLG